MKIILLKDHTYGKKGTEIEVTDDKSTYLINCGIAEISKTKKDKK